jgi:hypothetical protein
MVIVAVVAHSPTAGVNVYVVVVLLFKTGDHVPVIPLMEVVGKGNRLSPEQMAAICVKAGTVGPLIVTGAVAEAAAHPPAAAIVFVMVYVPAVLAARFISPVDVFTKTNPAGEAVNVPALDPGLNAGKGFAPAWQ